jgi:hypothetical protein
VLRFVNAVSARFELNSGGNDRTKPCLWFNSTWIARSIVGALKYIVSARACFHEALVHTIGPNGAVIRSMSAEYPAAIVIGRDAIR